MHFLICIYLHGPLKINLMTDVATVLKELKIKSNQIKSNQIKSNQIKSNHCFTIYLPHPRVFWFLSSIVSVFPRFSSHFVILSLIWSVLRGTLIRLICPDRNAALLLGRGSRKLVPPQWPSTGTVPTVVPCKMASNGTKLYYGPFEEFQALFFAHRIWQIICSLIFR